MAIKLQKVVNSAVLRFGVVLALSFAGFLFSRMKTKRIRPSLPPPPSSRSSDINDQQLDSEDRSGVDDDVDTDPSPRDPIPRCRETSSSLSEEYEKPYLKIKVDKSTLSTPRSRYRGDRDVLLLPELNSLVKGFDMSNTGGGNLKFSISKRDAKASMSRSEMSDFAPRVERDEDEQEIQHLGTIVRSLKEKVRNLEIELHKYRGLKDQESSVMELQNRLKINNVEAKLLSLKIDSLQADNIRLQAQAADYSKVVSELEAANGKINMLKRKLKYEAEYNREQIVRLQHRVSSMQSQELDMHNAGGSGTNTSVDPEIQSKLQKLEELEIEVADLKKSNYFLQTENFELSRKLETAQMFATSRLEDPKVEELRNEARHLKEENENLAKEVERLQSVRYADVEELVYLRWINACLRYELRNYQPPSGKTVARDLSRSLSPTSEKEAKRLILEYASTEENGDKYASLLDFNYDQWLCSQSYHTDSGEGDDVSVDRTSPNRAQKKRKMKFFGKLMELITGKESHLHTKPSALARTRSVEDLRRRYSHDLAHHSSKTVQSSQRSLSFSIDDVKGMEVSTNRSWTPSTQNSSRSSLELNRGFGVSEVDAKDMEAGNRSSCGSSLYSYRRFDLGGKEESTPSTSPFESQPDRSSERSGHKSELAKYAEALKESPSTRRRHRKAASLA